MEKTKPIVSIIVISFNSSAYIEDTLDSAKCQIYKNIELIVSDDCSTDDTVEKCENWIKKNKQRFIQVKVVLSKNNTGIAANCNRGIMAANGDWIKLIAGDDMLKNDCISNNIKFIQSNLDYQGEKMKIVHSSMDYYMNEFTLKNFIKKRTLINNVITNYHISSKLQYRLLLRGCYINSPSVFAKKEIFLELGGFDESLIVEDWPMWLKITASGNKIHYLDKVTINYRVRNDSLCNERLKNRIMNNHYKREKEVFEKYIYSNINYLERKFLQVNYIRLAFVNNYFGKDNYLNRIISKISSVPYWGYYKLYLPFVHVQIKCKIRKNESDKKN